MQRARLNARVGAILAGVLAAALLAGCGGEKTSGDNDATPSNPVLLVSAARAEIHPMTSELRLLGKTVAMRHVIVRAPTAGRVIGMKLVSGDSVRKGQVVAHVINREIEAAEAGLAVARRIDPQDAAALGRRSGATITVSEYQWSRRNRASSRNRRSPAARWLPTSIRLSI